ncbi:sugar ABC transporter permease [Vibrio sp. S9_S30]|uniref:carbohydrate ABC transporter permease n=1 Tax=Vibrio sp. S9_S30 TaxID=2720226 RepID=UPI0016801B41|nr:sugar ABC transporter permease [Vibrio sp. S9_S30]MBD1555855.1 sugar ABC transporter permease [Vibrio sp. S9_S30]
MKYQQRFGFPLIMIAPAVALIGILMYYPMFGTFIESLYTTSFINPEPEFVGFQLYSKLLSQDQFWQIIQNSVAWTLGVIVLQNLFGFLTALLLNEKIPGQGLMRSLVLLPWVLPGIVAAIVWRFMYDPQLGLINSMLLSGSLIDEAIAWLATPSTAMFAVVIAAVWKGFPFSTVVYLAALQSVDKEQIEAAIVDGAGPFRRLIEIIIPAVRHVMAINLLLTAILTFNYFDMVWVLTRGGPKDSTHIFPTKIFELGFGQFRFGEAATYGVMSILILVVLLSVYFWLQKRESR